MIIRVLEVITNLQRKGKRPAFYRNAHAHSESAGGKTFLVSPILSYHGALMRGW